MKSLCISTYVFGKDYQSFIPIYIYSILSAYPEYVVIIFVDGELDQQIKCNLSLIENLGDFKISTLSGTEIGLNETSLTNQPITRSIRWLYMDDFYCQFNAVYIGDIDIFICKENPGIYEQHMAHCQYLNLPYSNYVRGKIDGMTKVRRLIKCSINCGVKTAWNFVINPRSSPIRMSGLHFVQTHAYYPVIKKCIKSMIDELNLVNNGTSKKWNKYCFEDEEVLFELVNSTGVIHPEMIKRNKKNISGAELINTNDPHNIVFRPHHGLHLGLWRDPGFMRHWDEKSMMSDTYKMYYQYFIERYNNDVILRKLVENPDTYANKLIHRMMEYYESKYKQEIL